MIEHEFPDGTRTVSVEQPDGATEVTLELDGRAVSRTYVVPMLMRIGAAVVRMDGIGGVETEEEHRNRGYSRRVMETCVEKMRAGDAGISTLYGIRDFYPKYGYATTGPEHTVILPFTDYGPPPATLPPGWTFRPFVDTDLPAVQHLYHRQTRRATGPLVRHDTGDELGITQALIRSSPQATKISARAWSHLLEIESEPENDACRVLLDATGDMVGYAWAGGSGWWISFRRRYAPESFHLGEVIAADPPAANALLTACRLWASETGTDFQQLEIVTPPEGSVAAAAAYEGGIFAARHTWRGQFMGRVLDVGRFFYQLQPELSARIRAARLPFHGELTIRTDDGDASLAVTREGVSVETAASGPRLVAELPQDILARLCLGAFDVDDLFARLPQPPDPEVVPLLHALFPRRHPHIYPVDRF